MRTINQIHLASVPERVTKAAFGL